MSETASESAALALVPGLNNTAAVFADVVAALPADVRAFAMDNPALETVEAIADALLTQLPPRFWLAGFSFGGYVALAMLERAPERVLGLALVCTAPAADTAEQAARRRALIGGGQLAADAYESAIAANAPRAFHPDSLGDEALMARRSAMVHDYGPQRYVAHLRATIARPDRSHLLDGSRPTLAVAATHDELFPPANVSAYAQQVPGMRMEVIGPAGHMLPLEQPAALANCLAGWVRTAGRG